MAQEPAAEVAEAVAAVAVADTEASQVAVAIPAEPVVPETVAADSVLSSCPLEVPALKGSWIVYAVSATKQFLWQGEDLIESIEFTLEPHHFVRVLGRPQALVVLVELSLGRRPEEAVTLRLQEHLDPLACLLVLQGLQRVLSQGAVRPALRAE